MTDNVVKLVQTAETAGQMLNHAADIVAGSRHYTHGEKAANFSKIAVMWNAYLAVRREPRAPIGAEDVAMMMAVAKVARTQLGDFNPDDYVDVAGYAGCGFEIAVRLARQAAAPVDDGGAPDAPMTA